MAPTTPTTAARVQRQRGHAREELDSLALDAWHSNFRLRAHDYNFFLRTVSNVGFSSQVLRYSCRPVVTAVGRAAYKKAAVPARRKDGRAPVGTLSALFCGESGRAFAREMGSQVFFLVHRVLSCFEKGGEITARSTSKSGEKCM